MSESKTGVLSDLRAAAIAGIDKFISKAKREQRQTVEIRLWNLEVEAKKRAKKAAKAGRKVYGIGLDGRRIVVEARK